jgi:hypothetical protein
MNNNRRISLALGLGLVIISVETPAQDTPATLEEQYKQILKEFQEREAASHKEYVAFASPGGMPSDERRMEFIGRTFRIKHERASKLVDLAEKNQKDPIALDALIEAVWQVNTTPWPVELVGPNEALPRAFAILQRDHSQSDKIGPLCERISYGFCREYETFLRTVLEQSPHREVRGRACVSLAHYLSNRLQRTKLTKEQPDQAREFAGLYGAEYLADLQRQNSQAVTREVEALFERAARDFAEVSLATGTVAERAEMELFEIRHLSIGQTAPEIEGEDQEGHRFKLSEYRGKVVLLDFWSEY